MERRGRVALGMSGGVDSAVSAALLMRAGYEVVGVTCVFQRDESSAVAVRDAAGVCARLGIEHKERDCTATFEQHVIAPFVQAYAEGLTPSPCVGCNANAKVPALMAAADECGCDKVSTGHYARIVQVEGGRFAVMRALDAGKDQSYMLALLSQEQLSRLVLPLGAMTKAEVRILAADLGLAVADKPESQDVCFIGGDYRPFLQERGVTDVSGPIVDQAGVVLGSHEGLMNFTVGQRKGIGVAGPEPYYVVEKRTSDHALVVGPACAARITEAVVTDANWQAFCALDCSREAMVKLRYRSTPAACIIEPMENGRVRVALRSAQPTTASGQYAVFYSGDTVLGGGMIEEVRA